MMLTEMIIIGGVLIFILIIAYVGSTEKFAETTSTANVTEKPSYWNNSENSDTRSKCFDCDSTSPLKHGSKCFDCEIKNGRTIDSLLNRILTR